MKKIISLMTAFAIAFSLCVVNAAGIKFSGKSVNARCGETVDVTFTVSGNSGISKAELALVWDKSTLTLEDAATGDVFAEGELSEDKSVAGKYSVSWENDENVSLDGELFTLTFRVADNAEIGSYFITIGVNKLENSTGEAMSYGLSLPNVSVIGAAIDEPTEAPTEAPTEVPTAEPTEAPAQTPAPTKKPQGGGGGGGIIKPTETPTEAPTEEPTKAPAGNDIYKPAFTDVKEDAWYYDNVRYVYTKGLMNGVTDTEFGPAVTLTRAMLVTVLWRLEDEPVVNYLMTFDDVNAEEWYTEAVRWAAAEGIVNGYSETEFAPNAPITREQIATIIYKYADYKGIAPEDAWAIRLEYADLADIADYATDGVMYCKLAGIMEGKEYNKFEPKAAATRAEIAAVLQRFIEGNK